MHVLTKFLTKAFSSQISQTTFFKLQKASTDCLSWAQLSGLDQPWFHGGKMSEGLDIFWLSSVVDGHAECMQDTILFPVAIAMKPLLPQQSSENSGHEHGENIPNL